jgi:hypothetical protein
VELAIDPTPQPKDDLYRKKLAFRGIAMPVNTDLGELLLRLNPYANNADPSRALTGPVDIYTSSAPDWPHPPPGGPGAPTGTIAEVQLEMEGDYPAEWAFKGQPQKVYKTVRIKYRYPVLKAGAGGGPATPPVVLYWIEDYILIGYEGGPG